MEGQAARRTVRVTIGKFGPLSPEVARKLALKRLAEMVQGRGSECTQAAGAVAEYHVTRRLREVLGPKALPVAEHGRELQANGEPVFAELGCKAAEPNHPRHGAGARIVRFRRKGRGNSELRHAASGWSVYNFKAMSVRRALKELLRSLGLRSGSTVSSTARRGGVPEARQGR